MPRFCRPAKGAGDGREEAEDDDDDEEDEEEAKEEEEGPGQAASCWLPRWPEATEAEVVGAWLAAWPLPLAGWLSNDKERGKEFNT